MPGTWLTLSIWKLIRSEKLIVFHKLILGEFIKYKIAIVGAGPAGYFTAQAFQNAQTENLTFAIDMIERLPTPWGLVRSGVAPDHPNQPPWGW